MNFIKKALWTVGLSAMLCFAAQAFADVPACPYPNSSVVGSPNHCHVMLTVPASNNVNYPVYVYRENSDSTLTQIGYYMHAGQQLILDKYSSELSANYVLYYNAGTFANPQQWYSCTLSLLNGQLNPKQASNACSGIGFNQNAAVGNIQAGVYDLAIGANPWPQSNAPVPAAQPLLYQYRTITFVNNTQYKNIWIGEACTQADNPGNKNCINQNNIVQIPQGQPHVFQIDYNGLISGAFYVSAYENSAGKKVNTGGYFNDHSGGHTYATKFEVTAPTMTFATNASAPVIGVTPVLNVVGSNFDFSAVDGFNIGIVTYPNPPALCTYTIGVEGGPFAASTFSAAKPMATLLPTSGLSLSQLCQNSSQLPSTDTTDTPWVLSVFSKKSQDFLGCLSPCSYAVVNYGANSAQANQYCCGGSYNSPSACTVAPTSSYVQNLHQNDTHVYTFAYDDHNGDFQCPTTTNLTVSFYSAPIANTITFNGTPTTTNVTTNSATVNWAAASDSSPNATMSYSVQLTQNSLPVPNATITMNGNSANITGLTPATLYQVTVTATDNTGASATSQPASLTTATPTYVISTPTNVVASNPTPTDAEIAWSASTDTYPNYGAITYSVTATLNGKTAYQDNAISGTDTLVSGLNPGDYEATVVAQDALGNTSLPSSPVPFTIASNPTPNSALTCSYSEIDSGGVGTISWQLTNYNGPALTPSNITVTGAQSYYEWNIGSSTGSVGIRFNPNVTNSLVLNINNASGGLNAQSVCRGYTPPS